MAKDGRETFADLPFPEKGLDVNSPFSQQPPGTTATGVNCRVYDQLQMRSRGGSRSGLSKYLEAAANPGNLIQELNTVAHVDSQAIGSVNYFAGDASQTTLLFPGTYILANVVGGSFTVSTAIAVDANGNMTVGASQAGTPQGGDIQPLATSQQINLPAGYQVMAYWQPGVFPLSQGDWQNGPVFPGLGYFSNTFPGTTPVNFGFPTPATPGVSIPQPIPPLPFWLWPSGYETIEIELKLGISHCLVVAFNTASDEPFASATTLNLSLNGFGLPAITLPAANTGGLYVFTDDKNPFLTLPVPFSLFQIVSSTPVFSAFSYPFAGQSNVSPVILPAPTPAFNATGGNNLTATWNFSQGTPQGIQLVVCGLFRLKKFLKPDWSLGFSVNPQGVPSGDSAFPYSRAAAFTPTGSVSYTMGAL